MQKINQLKKLLNHPLNRNRKRETFLKIIWWKLNQVFFKIPAIIQITKSAKLICYPNSSYGSFVVYANFPEYEEMNFINKTITNGDLVIDVGANIGSESILAASKGKNVKVFAFEPTDSLIPLLKENIAINGFSKRVEIIQKAVSKKNGKIKFVLEAESEINHIASENIEDKNVKIVNCITLDTFVKEKGINYIDFLKVDVEGAELFVFQGAKNCFRENKISIILFELNKKIADFGYKSKELIELLKNNNFFVFKFDNNEKLSLINANYNFPKTVNLVAVSKKSKAVKKILEYV